MSNRYRNPRQQKWLKKQASKWKKGSKKGKKMEEYTRDRDFDFQD